MINHLRGMIIDTGDRHMILEVGGVGYKIFSTSELCLKARRSKENFPVWTHHVVREDASDLYGFETKDELAFFELLISISGIGPKSALGVMNVSPVEMLRRAIAASDTSHLTKVSGIGKKLAEKIVLELRDKVGVSDEDHATNLKGEVEVLEALKAIGYDHSDAREALKQIPPTITDTKERIRHALKLLGRQ